MNKDEAEELVYDLLSASDYYHMMWDDVDLIGHSDLRESHDKDAARLALLKEKVITYLISNGGVCKDETKN